MTGRLIVVSGPSGAGKGTILKQILRDRPDLALSISMTTREPRPAEADGSRKAEVDGVDYFFVDKQRFEELIAADGFLEHALVHGNYYGTPRAYVEQKLQSTSVILEIDAQGAMLVRQAVPDCILVYIKPPSLDELRARLVGRGTDDAATIEKRMRNAVGELEYIPRYDEVIVNDVLEDAVDQMESVLRKYGI